MEEIVIDLAIVPVLLPARLNSPFSRSTKDHASHPPAPLPTQAVAGSVTADLDALIIPTTHLATIEAIITEDLVEAHFARLHRPNALCCSIAMVAMSRP